MSPELLLQSICLWGVALFSLRVALTGNPLHGLIARTDPEFLSKVETVLSGERSPEPRSAELLFLRRFSRLVLLELLVVGVEVGLLVFFILDGRLAGLAWVLLAKDIAMLGLGGLGAATVREAGLFASILNLPRWMVGADRLSALVSGVGFVVFLLAVNGLIPG